MTYKIINDIDLETFKDRAKIENDAMEGKIQMNFIFRKSGSSQAISLAPERGFRLLLLAFVRGFVSQP
jgi:hypothetical protein